MLIAGDSLQGVSIRSLKANVDHRGDLHEVMRDSWSDSVHVQQWNIVKSRAGALRGMAVCLRNTAYFSNIEWLALLGLSDLRAGSESFGRGCVISLSEDRITTVSIPPGVVHGLYCETECTSLAGLSRLADPDDQLVCRWDDPDLNIPWPSIKPTLLSSDENAINLVELQRAFSRRRIGF